MTASGAPRSEPTAVRITDDPAAPAVRRISSDETHPYRQKELIVALNDALGDALVNSHDVQTVRAAHNIDQNPVFANNALYASRQYSEAFVEWIVDQYRSDPDFFHKARELWNANHTAAKT